LLQRNLEKRQPQRTGARDKHFVDCALRQLIKPRVNGLGDGAVKCALDTVRDSVDQVHTVASGCGDPSHTLAAERPRDTALDLALDHIVQRASRFGRRLEMDIVVIIARLAALGQRPVVGFPTTISNIRMIVMVAIRASVR
jgi:hypothetical protein